MWLTKLTIMWSVTQIISVSIADATEYADLEFGSEMVQGMTMRHVATSAWAHICIAALERGITQLGQFNQLF